MSGMGTGYDLTFDCPKYKEMWWRTRTENDRRAHKITLTGRKRKAPSEGKGHPRKSFKSREYRCSCGHVGWSCHIDLERMEARDEA